jgi:diguanylate cyclase (GGDEF)-like protein
LAYPPSFFAGKRLLTLLHADDIQRAAEQILRLTHNPGGTQSLGWRLQNAEGEWIWMDSVLTNLLDNPMVGSLVVNMRDLSERYALEKQLQQQALHDALTGLANRTLFRERLEHALARASRDRQLLGVMFLDLDHFKTINDTLGHTQGDLLLITVAERLQGCLREVDTAARLGGDEFAVLIEDIAETWEIERIALRIRSAFNQPVSLQGHEVYVAASIGISITTTGEERAEDLLRNADLAMYSAKRRDRGGYHFFEPEMNTEMHRRFDLKTELRRTLERNELNLHFQPIVRLDSGAIIGMEALARWDHPERGAVSPEVFIPIAEEADLIVPLGRWVLDRALSDTYLWRYWFTQNPLKILTLNLSPRQLRDPGLVDHMAAALDRSGLSPSCVVVELTESVLMKNTKKIHDTLLSLKDLGVKLAIDDFGIGYSSLAYLQQFPLDFLKIPKEFVDGIANEGPQTRLTQAIISMGNTLGMRMVAEGVETPEQANRLRQLGCEFAQGFYFAEPMPIENIALLMWNPSSHLSPQERSKFRI